MPANQNSACVDLNLDSAQDACSHIHNTVSHHLSTTSSQDTVPHLSAYACDVTSEDLVQQTFSSIIHDFGGIDVLVTAAGIVDNVAAEEYGFERWKMMLDVNLNGTFLCAREAGRHMLREGKGGSIVLVGSMSAFICVRPQKQAAYNTVSCFFFLPGGSQGDYDTSSQGHRGTALAWSKPVRWFRPRTKQTSLAAF
jgi:sorbose reductase